MGSVWNRLDASAMLRMEFINELWFFLRLAKILIMPSGLAVSPGPGSRYASGS
jgi:hypothetical protein